MSGHQTGESRNHQKNTEDSRSNYPQCFLQTTFALRPSALASQTSHAANLAANLAVVQQKPSFNKLLIFVQIDTGILCHCCNTFVSQRFNRFS